MTLPKILSIGTSNPPERFTQEEVYSILQYKSPKIREIFLNSGIEHRHLYIDRRKVNIRESPDELLARYREGALLIGQQAAKSCLERAGLSPTDIDLIITTTCTGYLCPDLSTLLIAPLGLRRDVQRCGIQGMGCAGAMPALQRAYDYVLAHPDCRALVIAVEICSACYFLDSTLETVVGNAICGDGAAAYLLCCDQGSLAPCLLKFYSIIDPSYVDKVGFEQKEGKLRIILSKDIPLLAGPLVERLLETIYGESSLRLEDIHHLVFHPGGRRVLEAIEEAFAIPHERLKHSWSVLRQYGNMSSPTVFFVLDEIQKSSEVQEGHYGLMMALGPGLALEAALLQWRR